MTAPFTPLVASLPATVPFVGPEAQERDRGRSFIARIGANENVFGPSPRAIEAMRTEAPHVWQYGDPTNFELRTALAAHHAIPENSIVIGEGVDALLGLTVRAFVAPGDKVVTSAGAYPTFNYHVAGFGGELVTVPYTGDFEDPEALIAKAREVDARLIYIANPDNPMASWHDAARIQAMIDAVPENCLLCLDEAYGEFAPDDALPKWDTKDTRVIRFRTFSKAYGLAGMRLGYAVSAPEVAGVFERVRNHFGVNRLAQAAALAALADQDYLADTRSKVQTARLRIAGIATDNGLTVLPSATNFVAIDCGRDGDFARRVLAALIKRDVFVRMPGVPPLDRCIRVSCAPEPEMELLAAALPVALAEATKA
jgi:histidinol-phosphate aminotransferase